jgi:hypothetical protein
LPADWKRLVREAGYRISAGDEIEVRLPGGTKQVIAVSEQDDALHCTSVIAGPKALAAAVEEPDSPVRYAWSRNRLSDMVGFRLDSDRRLIGEAWIPTAGLTAEEIGVYLHELARVCDWHEFRLTGSDTF